MEKGFIKLHRSLLEDDSLFRSAETFKVWVWILLSVDWKTGTLSCGRYQIAQWLKIKPSTVYQTLKRLQMQQRINMNCNNKATTIEVLNWSKYQANLVEEAVVSNGKYNNGKSEMQQQNDTYIRIKNKEDKNKEDIVIADKQQLPSKTKSYTRLPLEKRQLLHRVGYHLEDVLKTQIVNWGKQAKALKLMERAGYNEKQICWVINQMAQDEFYQDKGFDLMTVANSIAQYKAKARKAVSYVLPETN